MTLYVMRCYLLVDDWIILLCCLVLYPHAVACSAMVVCLAVVCVCKCRVTIMVCPAVLEDGACWIVIRRSDFYSILYNFLFSTYYQEEFPAFY